jgi:hypothetical protein
VSRYSGSAAAAAPGEAGAGSAASDGEELSQTIVPTAITSIRILPSMGPNLEQ